MLLNLPSWELEALALPQGVTTACIYKIENRAKMIKKIIHSHGFIEENKPFDSLEWWETSQLFSFV